MALSTDVIILSTQNRGLWLAAELVRLGWSVMWVQVKTEETSKRPSDFQFDDSPMQVGPSSVYDSLVSSAKEFVDQVCRPYRQEMALQILTDHGPLEFKEKTRNRVLKKFFPGQQQLLGALLGRLQEKNRIPKADLSIFDHPLCDRWCLEWLGQINLSREYHARDWFRRFRSSFDPAGEYLLLDDNLNEVCNRGTAWAERHGVKIKSQGQLVDIGVDGSRVTGIELSDADGFIRCKYLINTLGWDLIQEKAQRFSKKASLGPKKMKEKFVWVRTGFKLKPFSRPSGAMPWFSYVSDPYMPLREENLLILKWREEEKGDSLTVWVKITHEDFLRRGYLASLHEKIEKTLMRVFPRFEKDLVADIPFQEYFDIKTLSHDHLSIVYEGYPEELDPRTSYSNAWSIGPEHSLSLDLLGHLKIEEKLRNAMSSIRTKELKRDRKVHPPRDGRPLDSNQAV